MSIGFPQMRQGEAKKVLRTLRRMAALGYLSAWKVVELSREDGLWVTFKKLIKAALIRIKRLFNPRPRISEADTAEQADLDTSAWIEEPDLDTESKNKKHANMYQPVARNAFMFAMSYLPSDLTDFTFIDFGSGKGKALMLAAEFPFRKIAGVEFARNAHQIAADNLAKFTSPNQKCRDISVVCMDMVDFEIPNDPLVCFFYNPAWGPVMSRVFDNITRSLMREPRKIFVVYVMPRVASSVRSSLLGSGCFVERRVNSEKVRIFESV